MEWDEEGWPRIVGGHGGTTFVEGPKDAIQTNAPADHSQKTILQVLLWILTGIHCVSHLLRKWVQLGMAS